MNVLLIDHMASSRMLLRCLLETMDMDLCLHEFADPEEALRWCEHYKPDFVLLDNHLPTMHGLEFCNHFRLSPEHRDVPIALVTIAEDVATRRVATSCGIVEVILKPLHPPTVIARCAHHLQQRRGTRKPPTFQSMTARTLSQRLRAAWTALSPRTSKTAQTRTKETTLT